MRRVVIIGNGLAALHLVEELVRLSPGQNDIHMFAAERHLTYNRVQLSQVLAGEIDAQETVVRSEGWFVRHGVAVHLDEPVVRIDRARRVVHARSGRTQAYDRLVIATGSRTNRVGVAGEDLPGVIHFRDLDHVGVALAAAQAGKPAVVVGGGLLGLEAAHGLAERGMHVTVLHRGEQLMERQLDAYGSGLLRSLLERRGIRFQTRASVTAFGGGDRLRWIESGCGRLPTELAIVAIGVKPNITLAADAGLACRRGVLVDDTLQTFDPRVYAVGECVEHRAQVYGLVAPAQEQAHACASHLAGQGHRAYPGSLQATSLKVSGIQMYCAGDFSGRTTGSEVLEYRDPSAGVYRRFVLFKQRLVGFLLFGNSQDSDWYLDLQREGHDLSALRPLLAFGRAYADLAMAA